MIEAGANAHDRLARLQALAFVFDSEEQVVAARDRELASLTADEVASFTALKTLSPVMDLAEVLRASAELELLRLSRPTEIDAEVVRAMNRVVAASPTLEEHVVGLVRPLGLRGRVLGSSILVGVPGIEVEADAEHVAWQAAHEATVSEVSDQDWRTTERRAIALLRSRARSAGLGDSHARWLARFDLGALGGGAISDVEDPT